MKGTEDFHPVLRSWFAKEVGNPTDVQLQAWPSISSGRHTLIAAPTGSGKTLAALLPCLDRVVKGKLAGSYSEAGVRILYVTPLKALNNDIHHHAVRFVEEMEAEAERSGTGWPGIRVGVRTGDTSQSTRTSMLRTPPDLLVTTPESLYILLTSRKGREMLKTVEQVIVDEIHDLAADKRGLHLTVTLERLVDWCGRSPQRIGVSATQKPMERVARFLGGWEDPAAGETEASTEPAGKSGAEEDSRGSEAEAAGSGLNARASHGEESAALPGSREERGGLPPAAEEREPEEALGSGYTPRPVHIIESRMNKELRVTVTMPERASGGKERDMWKPILDRITGLMTGSRTTLVFVNSRRLCERLTLRLNDHAGYEMARSHHGSVSREKRLEVERMLKDGELRCLVATSSLELGIDVGHVDLVIQVDSPKTAAAGIQRFGRAGHAVGGISRGVILVRTRSELPEAAVLARAIAARDIEEIRVPRHSLDVLSQQIVAMTATEDWELGRLARTLARSDGFRGLPRARLEAVLQVLAGLYPFARPLLEWDRGAGVLRRRANTPMAAVMGAGTIPQSSGYPVHHAESKLHLGELDEEFVHETRVGDTFQLGTSSWRVQAIRHDRIYVTESANAYSEIPFWRAEALGRSREMGEAVGRFVEELDRRERDSRLLAEEWLMEEFRMEAGAADSLLSLIASQRASTPLPTSRRLVLEHFTDDASQHHLVLHSWFGRRFNRTWQLALQAKLEKKGTGRLYANARDNGIEFVFTEWDPAWPLLIRQLGSRELETLLLQAIPSSPLLGINFRRIAEVSLLLSRSFTRMPAWKKRLRSEELLKEALPYAEDFPFLREAFEESLRESLDTGPVQEMLQAMERER
ncbi:DEAD/DEAH box helicase [Paenibacillus sp. CC-CFT747]|nr:DEAD/DEAH box helicase [Paenibacillus sp. CC-CFT747]